jgi:hypothetical protein
MSDMRVIHVEPVADHVFEVTTESTKYGRVTQKVLVLPELFMGTPDPGCDPPMTEHQKRLLVVVAALILMAAWALGFWMGQWPSPCPS